VLEEILELESRGIEVHIFSLGMPDGRIDDTTLALARLRSPVRYLLDDEIGESPSIQNRSRLAADSIGSHPGNGAVSREAHWIASLVLTRRIEHLHAHGATVAADVTREVGRLTGLGYSFTAHADGLYEGADLPSLREKTLEARFAVALSKVDRGRLLGICGPAAAHKLHRIPMAINPDDWRFAEAECHDCDSVLAVGPLVRKSGFTDLIEAIGILRDRGRIARLTIVGEGEFEDVIRAEIDRYGLASAVQLIASVSRRELATLMRVHTAMALPWVADDRDRDVLANMVLEAMAVGLPVLSTDLPGIRELIDDGLSGRVISARDPLWLAGALETLFDSPELRERMARRARTKVERLFTATRNVSDLARLFFEAVATRRLAS
jgi:glycosyltransferase involved in cell wall biosynthesis